MKQFRRLSSLVFILLVWACHTSDAPIQPSTSGRSTQARIGSAGIHKLKPRFTITPGEGASSSNVLDPDIPQNPDDGSGGPTGADISQANGYIDEINASGDQNVIDQTNALVDSENAMSAADFNATWASFIESLRRFIDFVNCQPYRRSQAAIQAALDDPGKRFYSDTPFLIVSGSTKTVRWNLIGPNYTVGFGEEGDLRGIIGCGTDDQAHHIIPSQWTFPSGSAGMSHPVVQKAALDGFHPNDGYNGVCLPSTQHHYHPQYNDYVKFQLDQYIMQGGAMTPQATNKWLQCVLIKELRRQLAAMPTGANLPTINSYYAPINSNRRFIGLL